MSDEALELAEQHGGIWAEHPDFPVEDWQHEVANDETRQSYWDWVLKQAGDS